MVFKTPSYFLLSIILIIIQSLNSEANKKGKLTETDTLFKNQTEIYFSFDYTDRASINKISKIISLHKIQNGKVYAYANLSGMEEFKKYNHTYTLLPHPSLVRIPKMSSHSQQKIDNQWNYYLTYPAYESLMQSFAIQYHSICKLDTIGILPSGKKLLAIKISGSKEILKSKPKFLYTSSMHGNELTGYILMLRLIDTLLTSYGNDKMLSELIDNIDIYINPLANPDGTYRYNDSTVYGATRFNKNNVDLNRNYPDAQYGAHPDGNQWQPETQAYMEYAKKNKFNLSANLHGGAELINYPWDTWERKTADDGWWRCVCTEFADTVHKYSKNNYFMDNPDYTNIPGVTNGYQWYEISGGRMDYMNFFHQCREVTIEISYDETPLAEELPLFWNYTKKALINYIGKSLQGIKGLAADSITKQPVAAKVYIPGHDKDSSHVSTTLPYGDFYRYISGGVYDIILSSPGFYSKTIKNIFLPGNCDSTLYIKVSLSPLNNNILQKEQKKHNEPLIYPVPNNGIFSIINLKGKQEIFLTDVLGKKITEIQTYKNSEGKTVADITGLSRGIYYLHIISENHMKILKTIKTN